MALDRPIYYHHEEDKTFLHMRTRVTDKSMSNMYWVVAYGWVGLTFISRHVDNVASLRAQTVCSIRCYILQI